MVKNLTANAGDSGSVPGLGRSPREGNGNPFQYSCWGNLMDREAYHASLSMGFSRQEYWSGLPFPSLGDLPNLGIKPTSPVSPALVREFFTTEPPGKPLMKMIPSDK